MSLYGNKESLFPCFIMRELGEDDCEKGGALSHIRPTYTLIYIVEFLVSRLNLTNIGFCLTM